ncbi:TRAP transporter fused permease subunit [Acuticoccus sp. M5D2P5]|uniref:TRAP transporter permease n=1 Tax=Acuticoccus kalidii TaxID=2910977 RepID=UPI001F1A403A|nr:TRAP transporter fused permease subunit [Acuticoccus kalidii]MCF3933731.1 TRAP transporter fused permease subunit [Acuticoccus kalidii]
MHAPATAQPLHLFVQRIAVVVIGAVVLGTALYSAFFGAFNAYVHRPLFLFAAVACVILVYPSGIFRERSRAETIFNVAVIALMAVPTIYLATQWEDMLFFSYLSPKERFLAVLLVLCVFEAARRTTALPLIFVVTVFVLYAVYGNYIPGILNHAGVSWENALKVTVLGFDGIFGTPLGFAAGFVTVFVFFTALLTVSGVGNYLLNLTFALCGNARGGPGKVSVVGSALMGMVTGSGITNVLTTGTITIPLMRRAGYSPSFAAGVEAVASTGSQFVPPLLGASAFLMAEYTNTPFILIAAYCLVPALLYYGSLFAQVHFRSCRVPIKSEVPPDEGEERLTVAGNALRSLLLFVPIVVLVTLLVLKFSIDYAISVAFIIMLIGTQLYPRTRLATMPRVEAFARESASTLGAIAVALALAGIVVGMLLLTGLGARLATLITAVAGGSMFLTLVMCAVIAIIVGMGVVTVGAYVIVASLVAPVLIDFGIPVVVAHLFIFYYAVLSGLSPPVAVVIFAAAGVAKAPALRVAWIAMRLGFVAWLVPFMFAYYPNLIGLNGINGTFLLYVSTALVGVVAFSAALEGWAVTRTSPLQRVLFAVGGAALLYPHLILSVGGAVILVVAYALNLADHRKSTVHFGVQRAAET